MKITKVDNRIRTTVGELSIGEVFQQGQCYFIKTNETATKTGDVLAVNLQTGILVQFSLNIECNIVECELMIK